MPATIILHSPNCERRPDGEAGAVSAIVMHCTESDNTKEDVDWLCNPKSGASAHDLIDRDGTRYSLVPASMRAWHAGVSTFAGRARVNDFSIGIELANDRLRGEYYPNAQLDAAARLVAGYMVSYPAITLDRITRHSDIAVGRKNDPGTLFSLPGFRALVQLYAPWGNNAA